MQGDSHSLTPATAPGGIPRGAWAWATTAPPQETANQKKYDNQNEDDSDGGNGENL